jgi:cytochrome c oxidase subunit 2
MVDSNTVLFGQTLIYTFYALAIILLVGWFAYRVTTDGPSKVKPAFFYTFVGFLILLGVTIHIVTFNTIPWAPMDLNRADIKADKVFDISVQDHKFQLPAEKLMIKTKFFSM